MSDVATHLIRVGFDRIAGFMSDDMDAWENQGFAIAKLETMSVQELASRLKQQGASRPIVLDVRTDGEWNGGHIDGALHIHAGLLSERMAEVPRDRTVAAICGTGYRGSIAASLLKRAGYEDVANVPGGMTAWQAAGLATVR